MIHPGVQVAIQCCCNPVLLQLLQTVFRVATWAPLHLACSGAEDFGVPLSEEHSEEECSDQVQGRECGHSSVNSEIRRAQEEASKDRAKAADLQQRLAEVTAEKAKAQRRATLHEHRCAKLQAFQAPLESKDLLGLAAQVNVRVTGELGMQARVTVREQGVSLARGG